MVIPMDLKFCTHIHEPLPSNMFYGFSEKKNILREKIEKEKEIEHFGNLRNFENPR